MALKKASELENIFNDIIQNVVQRISMYKMKQSLNKEVLERLLGH